MRDGRVASGTMSSSVISADQMRPSDHDAITIAPMMPTAGSIQYPTVIARRQQGDDRQNRSQSIGKNVQIGGTQIRIMMPVTVMTMVAVMLMFVIIMVLAQQECAYEVHRKTDNRDCYGLVKADGHGCENAPYGFIADEQSHQHQNNRAGKSGQLAQLAVPNVKRGSCTCLRAKR